MGKRAAKRRTTKGERRITHSEDDVLSQILRAARISTRKHAKDPAKRLVILTMGTLTAVKLLLRLQNKGGTSFTGNAEVWERVEQMSDDLAHTHFGEAFQEYYGADIPGIRLRAERDYLHVVRNRHTFQWCPTSIDDNEASPIALETLEGVHDPATDAMFAIVEAVGKLRDAVPDRDEQQKFHMLTEWVALVTAAKMYLAVWGNGKTAAAYERLADLASEHEYAQIMHAWSAREPTE